VKDFETRGPSSSFAVGYAPARVADTKPRQQTPDEKDEAAETLAGDLERHAQLVRDDVAAIRIAAAAEDLADWTDAANDAVVGLSHVRDLVTKAPAAKLDATGARVRADLENAAQVLADTEALIAGAPAAPKLGAPVVRCADALLAVLAPDRPLGWEAERAVVEVVDNQATYSDLVALRAIAGERADHKLAPRFKQFSKVTRKKLVRILSDRELEDRARARQEAQRQARRVAARAATPVTAQAQVPTDPVPAANDVTDAQPSMEVSRTALAGGVSQRSDGGSLPYRAEMERSFGRSLGQVQAHTGMASELAPHGAQALATGDVVAFADAHPSPALVAHEVTHAVQYEQAGIAAPMASGVVAPRDSAAEAEADAIAGHVAVHGPGVRVPPITAAPAAHVHLAPSSPVPELRLDKTKDAQRLHALVAMRQQREIVELLEQDAHPEHMYALHRAYGSMLVPDVQGALTEAPYLARARVYLGEQMSLDAKIGSRGKGDTDAILGDLERISDARVLALFEGDAVTVAWTPLAARAAPEPTAAWLPATTTLTAVKQALHGRLGADDYYRAMRLLLAKADRAIAVQNARAGNLPQGLNLDGFTFTLDDLTIDPPNPDVLSSPVALSPVSKARVDLTEARIREADAAGNWLADPMKARHAGVALADLDRTERRAMAIRLRDKPLANALGGMSLGMDALELDDATSIQTAILNVQTLANLKTQAAQGVGFDVALERAGELVRAARAKLEQLPPNAPAAERTKAQAEVQRLESMFFGQGSPVLEMLRVDASRAGDSDGGVAVLESQLRALGADSVTIATERLRVVPIGDAAALIAALRKVAAENRLLAMQRSGQLDALSTGSTKLTPDQGELLSALLWQGTPPLGPQLAPVTSQSDPRAPQQPPATDPSSPPILMPPGLGPPLLGPRPELVIALHDILDAMGKGAAHEILGRLARMTDADQRAIYTDPRYRAKLNALPEGEDRSPERDFKDSLRAAETSGAKHALLRYPGPGGDDDVYQKVLLESMAAQVDTYGQANMRRAYVLVERLGGRQKIAKDPTLLDTLSPEDRSAVARLVGAAGNAGLLGDRDHLIDNANDKETASQIILGQPQLSDTHDAALDPTMEAELMYFRLRDAAGIRGGSELMDSFDSAGAAVDESVTEFMVLYQQVRPGGVDRGELVQLAELYHRATRRLDTYRKATDSFASSAAQVVGAVVATVVVTIASGGTLGPVAVGAMAAVSGAAASAATGAAIRIDNTTTSLLKDAGTGAIEGIAAAAGASLAAKIVRGATMGVSASRAAATAGAHAAGHATGGLGASIAEAAIDGAIGGAAGDLFQTATDEATWDRGIAEAFSALLAAIARGAATGGLGGAAVGGVVGGLGKLSRLAARLGDSTAHEVGRLLESAGVGAKVLEHLSEKSEDQLARVVALLRARQIDEAERALAAIEELPGHARAMLASVARVRVMMETVVDLGPVDLEGILVLPRIVDDREFRKLAGGRRGDAVVLIENGQPQIVMRQSASASALREELTHLSQWKTDPMMRRRMAGLSEDRLANWKQVSSAEKLELHLDKLEVEADAQRRIIDQLGERAAEDPEAATAVLDAEETLFELGQRIDKLRAVRGQPHLDAKALGIDEAPRLFARGAQSPKVLSGPRVKRAEKLIDQSINDPKVQQELGKLGYDLARREKTGRLFRISRRSERFHELPHLSVDQETGIIRKGEARKNFAERKEDAARKWRSESEQLRTLEAGAEAGGEGSAEARRAIADTAPRFRAELARRIATGTLDEGGAGMLARWGKVLDQLDMDGMVPLQELLARLPHGPLTEAGYDGFRHGIRRRTVDALMAIEDPAERVKALHKLLEIQPESASKGHLFTEFRRDLMTRTMHEGQPVYSVDGKRPQHAFEGPDLGQNRKPDDVIQIRAEVEGQLPGGRYAIEDKTGEHAFKLDQAEDYARRSVNVGEKAGGFKLTPKNTTAEYDGLVIVFSRRGEAKKALEKMRNNDVISPILERHPGGIHVMYLDAADGRLKLSMEAAASGTK